MQKMVKPIRLVVLAVVFVLLLGVYFVALYKLQIIGGREYYAVGETETKEDITIAAARGNILDRYGRLLVSNSLCNNLSINVTELFSQDDPNAVILELCSAVERFGDTYTDTLPITKAPPFEFTEMDTLQKSMLDAWLKANDMPLDSSAVEILAAMRTRYSVGSEYNAEDARRIVGVRYEINDRFNINTTPYVFAEDVSMPLLTYLMEQDIPGFELSSSYVREYKTQYAAHLLGYTGKLTAEEFEVVKTHAAVGASILQNLPMTQDEPLIQVAYQICRWHHERYDGHGYPDGLVGDQIPITAQVVSLADVYDALTGERCYKKAYPHETAVRMIQNGECGVFNPNILACFREIEGKLRTLYGSGPERLYE